MRAARLVWAELGPLLDLFATVNEVFDEQGAFDEENIHKSLGRIYREWLACRSALDPEFNPKRYRQEMRDRAERPLRAAASTNFSLGRKWTFAKNQRPRGRQGNATPSRSATTAHTSRNASRSHSSEERNSEYGEE